MDLLSKDTARQIVLDQLRQNPTELLREFISWIRHEVHEGSFKGNFYTGGKHFTKDEWLFLEHNGWSKEDFTWNSACLWYEVDWS